MSELSPEDIVKRVGGLYDALAEITNGSVLTCQTCGATTPAEGRYWRIGWPKCCGRTMILHAALGGE